MAGYGLKIDRNYGDAVLFDSRESCRSMTLVSSGTLSYGSSLTYKAGDAVLVRPNGNVQNASVAFTALTSISGTGQDVEYTARIDSLYANTAASNASLPSNLAYVILREANQQNAQSGGYGLLCKTSATIVEFDSRLYSSTTEFLIQELYTSTYGHGSTLSSDANSGVYYSLTLPYRSEQTGLSRYQGYIFEHNVGANNSINNFVYPGNFVSTGGGSGYYQGREIGTTGGNGTVRSFCERQSIGGGSGSYFYTDRTLQGYYTGVYRS